MKDEIKEILDNIKYELDNKRKFILMTDKDTEILLDYITNLQEENEDLREDNYAYHQIIEKDKQLDKYKNVIDKIKEYCELNKEFTPRLEDILELLEEVE